jgi:hypothetical protein
MSTYVQLYGGCNYSHPKPVAHRMTLAVGRWRWIQRQESNGHLLLPDDDDRGGRCYFPGWGDPGANDLDERGRWYGGYAWFVDSEWDAIDTTDLYPDRVLVIGPRGGARWEPA